MAQIQPVRPVVDSNPVDPLRAARAAAQAAESRQGENILVLDIAELSSFADYFVLISGKGERHVKALREAISEELGRLGLKARRTEGQGRWILLDYIDVVVHIFDEPLREFYNIERLWADAPEVEV